MDIVGKETLEDILKRFEGTVLFVSHDRYFIKEISDSLLVFEPSGVKFLPYGYSQYLEMQNSVQVQEIKEEKPKLKKTYTTPLKEIGKKERAVKKEEEKIAVLEEKIEGLKTELCLEENLSDYLKLSELQKELEELQIELDCAYSQWEQLSRELEMLLNPEK